MQTWRYPIEAVLKHFSSNAVYGLDEQQVAQRLKRFGYNRIGQAKPISWMVIVGRQCRGALIYLLFFAAIAMIIVGQYQDAVVALGVVLFNVIIGSIQEKRTNTMLERLSQMLSTQCMVIRSGQTLTIDQIGIVPGDVVILQEGGQVPADIRIFFVRELIIDESCLTGEMAGIAKNAQRIEREVSVFEQKNIAFQGTFVLSGVGRGVVVATGRDTYLGQIQQTVRSADVELPLQKELSRLSRWIVLGVLICLMAILLIACCISPMRWHELFSIVTALLVAAVPEGLATVTTFILVRGAYSMARKNFLIKNLQAVATLGSVFIILTDKTGTLTLSELMVTCAYTSRGFYTITGNGYEPIGSISCNGRSLDQQDYQSLELLVLGVLPSDTQVYYDSERRRYRVSGSQTEAAIITFAKKLGIDKDSVFSRMPLEHFSPFDKKKRFSVACFKSEQGLKCFVVAAPELLLEHADAPQDVQDALNHLLGQGLRVIGVAVFDAAAGVPTVLPAVSIIGWLGMQDALRHDSVATVQRADQLGVRVALVTGDHPTTAGLVAQQLGLKSDGYLTGVQFAKMAVEKQKVIIEKVSVYARFLPEEKYGLVERFQEQGAVAMIGDGVNDAPSLARADVGIAMGSGTSVAKGAADAVVVDDRLSTVLDAIVYGRHVFDSLRRIVFYFLTGNVSEVFIVMLALVLSYPLPLMVSQILWMNIVTDGFMDIALALEPISGQRALRRYEINKIFDWAMVKRGGLLVLVMVSATLGVFVYALSYGVPYARTMTLTTLVAFQWFNAWNCRSERLSLFTLNARNYWLVAATIIVFVLQVLASYWSYTQHMLSLSPMGIRDWILCFGVASSIVLVEEARKFLVK